MVNSFERNQKHKFDLRERTLKVYLIEWTNIWKNKWVTDLTFMKSLKTYLLTGHIFHAGHSFNCYIHFVFFNDGMNNKYKFNLRMQMTIYTDHLHHILLNETNMLKTRIKHNHYQYVVMVKTIGKAKMSENIQQNKI